MTLISSVLQLPTGSSHRPDHRAASPTEVLKTKQAGFGTPGGWSGSLPSKAHSAVYGKGTGQVGTVPQVHAPIPDDTQPKPMASDRHPETRSDQEYQDKAG